MIYRSAIKKIRCYFKCATLKCVTLWIGFSFMIVSPLQAETPPQRFLTNQATVTYTKFEETIVTHSNESVVPINSQAEIALKSLIFNEISPKIFSLLLLESKTQRFLVNQATVTYEKSEKSIIASSNESVVPIIQPAEIKLKIRNPPKSDVLVKDVSPSL